MMMWDYEYNYGASFWISRIICFAVFMAIIVVAVIVVYYFINRIRMRSQHNNSGASQANVSDDHKAFQAQQEKTLESLQSITKELQALKKKK